MSYLGTGTRTLNENVSKRYLTLEKENIPVKRETDEFILTKDSGKQFTNSTPNGTAGKHWTLNVVFDVTRGIICGVRIKAIQNIM